MANIIFGAEAHTERLDSLASEATGMPAARAAIHAIAAAYAHIDEFKPRHGEKQVDRYLGNQGIDVEALTPAWIGFVLGSRRDALIALDWTECDAYDHASLCAYLLPTQGHGRATPLCWQTVQRSTLDNRLRGDTEVALIERLARAIPPESAITLLADRGLGHQPLHRMLVLLGWHHVIRFRSNIAVTHAGESRPAHAWLPASGHATKLVDVEVTSARTPVGAVVLARAKRMKEPWCLATSLMDERAAAIVELHARRFKIEESPRTPEALPFDMGLREIVLRKEARRDRLLMLLALGQALLTLLGAASERSGLDRYLKANTAKHRTQSLLTQGTTWFEALPEMRDDWLERLMSAFAEVLAEQTQLRGILDALEKIHRGGRSAMNTPASEASIQ
jgi:hypothetical protein